MTALLWIVANWRPVLLAALVLVPIAYGSVMRHQRDSARETIKQMVAAGKAQEERTKAEIERQKEVTKGVEDEHQKRAARLVADNARLRDQLRAAASRSLVPAVPDASSGDDDPVACFDRGLLNAELRGVFQRYAERLTAIASEGESVSAAFSAGQDWILKELAKTPAPQGASSPAR